MKRQNYTCLSELWYGVTSFYTYQKVTLSTKINSYQFNHYNIFIKFQSLDTLYVYTDLILQFMKLLRTIIILTNRFNYIVYGFIHMNLEILFLNYVTPKLYMFI